MSATARTAQEAEPAKRIGVIYKMIGSRAFKGALALIGIIVVALLSLGLQAWARAAAESAPSFVATKADVDTLKVAVKQVSETAQLHTYELADVKASIDDTKQVQQHIFDSLKALSSDVHNLDNHIGKVEQKVDDQADNLRSSTK